jgi:predicted O-methyltransferase YrrM
MWYRIKSFIKFYLLAGTKFNVHSSFLYDFVLNVLDTGKEYYVFQKLENLRTSLLLNQEVIQVKDFGAGSRSIKGDSRQISNIASTSLSHKTKCRILFQITEHYQCQHILELGTSLGISSAYTASTARNKNVITLEGDPNIAKVAQTMHQKAGLNNIKIITGPFAETLAPTLMDLPGIDLAFIDGHHQYEATKKYFDQIIEKCHAGSIIILDDIYWSEGMTRAWEEVIKHPKVSLTIDLYDIGILFLNPDLSKEYIRYISYKYKPWKIGLFR